jgi:SAM-dependent methyltransferase
MHRKDPFRIVRCRGCGLVYTLPRLAPDQLVQMYQVDYWKSDSAKDFGYTDYLADEELYVKTFRMRSALVRKFRPPPAAVLDVGCAAGFALRAFREEGYDPWGIELSAPMAEQAARRVGAERIHAGTLEPGVFGGRRFDVVTLWDVVEHIEDPIEFLRQVRGVLADDGILVLETQNVASWFARLMGVRWQHYKFEEHLYHFDPRTVQVLLDRAGFELAENSPRRGGKYVSLHFITERVGRIHPWLSILAWPLRLLGNPKLYVNVFDEMLIVARPRPEAADA